MWLIRCQERDTKIGAKKPMLGSTFNAVNGVRRLACIITVYRPRFSERKKKKAEEKKRKRKRKRIYVNLEQTAKLSSLLRRGGLRHCRPNNFHLTARKYFVRPLSAIFPSIPLSLSAPFRRAKIRKLGSGFPARNWGSSRAAVRRREGGEFSRGKGRIFQWTIRCRARRWRGTPEGEHLETRHCNYEPYHVGASLVTNSLYCPPFRDWPRVDALYLAPVPPSRGRGPAVRPENNVSEMKERKEGRNVRGISGAP